MGTTAQKLQAIQNSKSAIKTAIENKGVTVGSAVLAEYASKIASIPSGTDVSDTTAVANDVLAGKDFHLANGTKTTGTIISKSAENYTPTTTAQTINSGVYLSGNQTIQGDANLIASNIKKDVQIFNVTGTYQGGGSADTVVITSLDSGSNQPPAYIERYDANNQLVFRHTYDDNYGSRFNYDSTNGRKYITWDFANLTSYKYLFALMNWKEYPSFTIKPSVTDYSFMYFCLQGIANTGKKIVIPALNSVNGTNFQQMFTYSTCIGTITSIDLTNATNVYEMFRGCSQLQNITFTGTIPKSISFNNSNKLTHESLMSIINHLVDLTGQTGQTLTLGSTNLAKLTAEEKAIGTNKNWNLV